MTAGPHSPHSLMIRKLDSIFRLSKEEKQALQTLQIQVQVIGAHKDIARIGDSPSQCCLLVEGYISVYKLTDKGKRQIMAFHVPGDMPDLQSLHLQVLDNSLMTATLCTVGFIQHDDLHRVSERYPRITSALWRETLVDASIFREWVLNVGRRDAVTRMAHLLCELRVKLKAVGLAEDDTFDLPFTQVELADAIGTSNVHVNRVLKELRARGLIQSEGTRLTIPDWEKLKELAGFDPLYLHLKNDQAAA
jgi:CRP-like cAMP-binding protein